MPVAVEVEVVTEKDSVVIVVMVVGVDVDVVVMAVDSAKEMPQLTIVSTSYQSREWQDGQFVSG